MKKIIISLIIGALGLFTINGVNAGESICMQEYAPVCGSIAPGCSITSYGQTVCPLVGLYTKTFTNKCYAEKSGAKILYDGKCEFIESKIITEKAFNVTDKGAVLVGNIELNSVTDAMVGFRYGYSMDGLNKYTSKILKVEDGKFQIKISGLKENTIYFYQAYYIYREDDMMIQKEGNIIMFKTSSNNYNIPSDIKNKINNLLNNLYEKLDRNLSDNEKKIDYLEKLNSKLDEIYNRKPQFGNIIKYIQNKNNDRIDYYDDDSEIYDLLN